MARGEKRERGFGEEEQASALTTFGNERAVGRLGPELFECQALSKEQACWRALRSDGRNPLQAGLHGVAASETKRMIVLYGFKTYCHALSI